MDVASGKIVDSYFSASGTLLVRFATRTTELPVNLDSSAASEGNGTRGRMRMRFQVALTFLGLPSSSSSSALGGRRLRQVRRLDLGG